MDIKKKVLKIFNFLNKYKVIFFIIFIILFGIVVHIEYKKNKSINHHNIIFIFSDALRADHLGSYGYSRNVSPNIDELAKDGVLFENAFSQASCTFPSVNTILTSKYAYHFYKNYEKNSDMGISKNITSIVEILKKYDYKTGAISASPIVRKTETYVNKEGGFDRGFDNFIEDCYSETEKKDILEEDIENITKKSTECLTDKSLKWLEKNYKKKFFLFLYYMDPHNMYYPPKSYRNMYGNYTTEKDFILLGNPDPIFDEIYNDAPKTNVSREDINYLINLYDGEIKYVDDDMGKLFKKLDDLNLMDNTLIIFTSDHGEEFLEHNSMKHCMTLYDQLIHVPLIMKIPNFPSKRIKSQVRSIDIVPTILDILNISTKENFQGISLLPTIKKDDMDLIVFSEQEGYIEPLTSIRTGDKKLICSLNGEDKCELYDIKEDPYELVNLIEEYPKIVERLKERLFIFKELANISKSTSKELEKLRSLGYL